MATGDVRGNLERMRVQLRSISYPHCLDTQGAKDGLPAAILPLLHYALLGYSRHLARYLSINGYILHAKSDLRFVECVIKLLRKEFDYRCPLTVAQIFAKGFAEKKFLFLHDVIQMCKRKHNELLLAARQSDKKRTRSQPKALGRNIHKSICRHKHLTSKMDRRCELDASPTIECKEICRTCKGKPWIPPSKVKTACFGPGTINPSLMPRETFQDWCYPGGSSPSNAALRRTATLAAQLFQKESEYRSQSPGQRLQERVQSHEGVSPRLSPAIHGNKIPKTCTSPSAPQEVCEPTNDFPKLSPDLCNDSDSRLPSEPVYNGNQGSQEESLNSQTTESTPDVQLGEGPHIPSQEMRQHDNSHLHSFSAPTIIAHESAGPPSRSSPSVSDDCPPAMWQKIMDLANKIDSCFNSLDTRIGKSFNSIDNKLETKFKYLDAGVMCTRETLQEKLSLLETRIQHLESASRSPSSPHVFHMAPQVASSVIHMDDQHPLRDISNTFDNGVDNRHWRNYNGLQTREYLQYPSWHQHQDLQTMQKLPLCAGLLKANTQDFIASVRARFNQTREVLVTVRNRILRTETHRILDNFAHVNTREIPYQSHSCMNVNYTQPSNCSKKPKLLNLPN